MSAQDRAYLSIIGWPDALDEAGRAEALAVAAGLDLYTARNAVRRGAPQVAALIDAAIREDVVRVLREFGVNGFCPTRDELGALPDAVPARRLGRVPGKQGLIAVVPIGHIQGRAEAFAIKAADVNLVIRAIVKSTSTTIDTSGSGPDPGAMMAGMAVGGLGGAVMAGAMSSDEVGSRSTKINVEDLVELHGQNADGHFRIRCDIRRWPPSTQEDRLRSPMERADRLAEALASMCPQAAIDIGFRSFVAPVDVVRRGWSSTGSRTVSVQDEAGKYEFFSRWRALLELSERGVSY